ncbi:MAG TPA: hypothetical protein VKB88_18800 [Bryobacteraceae bacterium]|nr:hypothetical protein [Bryobacteraceae bacterium]
MLHDAIVEANPAKRFSADTQLPGSVLARFLELRGRRIIHACAALWYTIPGRFLMSLPYERMLSPEPQEMQRMLRDARVFGARFPSLIWTGLESGLYVLNPGHYDLGSLHVKHRPRVRHALKCFEFRLAQKAELLDQGRALNLTTMSRQGRYDPEFGDARRWERFVEAAFACPGISVPAVFSGSRLSAYMITCREQGWLHILHQMSRLEDLSDFPNHLLTYSVSSQAASDTTIESVCYGYVPLFSADGLHEYKLRFGYRLIPHRSAIQLHPVLKAGAEQPVARAAVHLARRLRPHDQRLETIESVLNGARSSARG